jgi:hypothetical protein
VTTPATPDDPLAPVVPEGQLTLVPRPTCDFHGGLTFVRKSVKL